MPLPSPLESSPNCPPTSPPPPQLVEKLSSARPAPDARKVGDHSSRQHPRCRQSLFPGCALGCDSCFLKFTYLGCAGSLLQCMGSSLRQVGFSLVVALRLSCPMAHGNLVPRRRIEPALEGGFLTTGPSGKSLRFLLDLLLWIWGFVILLSRPRTWPRGVTAVFRREAGQSDGPS